MLSSLATQSGSFARTAAVLLIAGFSAPCQPVRTAADLMQRIFDALERRDEQKLKALAISKLEFKSYIWPGLRRSMVARLGINAEALYSMSAKESEIGLAATLKEFGGREWHVIQVAPLTPERHRIRRKRFFVAYPGPAVTIRSTTGVERTVHVVGGIVEFGGVYKVSTYSLAPDQRQ